MYQLSKTGNSPMGVTKAALTLLRMCQLGEMTENQYKSLVIVYQTYCKTMRELHSSNLGGKSKAYLDRILFLSTREKVSNLPDPTDRARKFMATVLTSAHRNILRISHSAS